MNMRKIVFVILNIVYLAHVCFLSFSCDKNGVSPHSNSQQYIIKDYSLDEISFVKSIVDSITEEELRNHILALQNMGTRYAPSRGNLRAANYIKEAFYSCDIKNVRFDEFSYYNDLNGLYETTRNVVASKPGVKTPKKAVIIGAHFDTIAYRAKDGRISALDNENPAPGADDNATGIAAILAAARVLGQYEFDHTIRFVAFSAEERGLHGSAHYAAEMARKSEDIIAVINIDMIGYIDQKPEDIDIFANNKSAWLLDKVTNNAPLYAPGLLVYRIINDKYDGSDHAPFWNNGYPAICFMEDYYPSNRLYHAPTDTLDTVNFPFTLKSVRLAAATLAELAGIHVNGKPPIASELTRKDIRAKAVNWQKDAGKRFLFTLSPSSNKWNVVDISIPNIHSSKSISLGDISPETWGQPHFYPVAASRAPSSKLIYVSMIKLRAPGKENEQGIVKIADPKKAEIAGLFQVGRHPSAGCFNADGTKFYLPYWGEKFIDIFDTTSLKRINQISTPVPIRKLAVDESERDAIGISPETNSVVIINLADKSIEKVINEISVPKDIILVNNKFAIVCSYDQAKIYQIDMDRKEIIGEINTIHRPMHLILSPQEDTLISIHHLSSQINLFRINKANDKLILEKDRVLDTGEVIAHGTFADNDIAYFISSGKYRLFGLNLSSGKVFWGMRTGGVRARGGVDNIIFIEE